MVLLTIKVQHPLSIIRHFGLNFLSFIHKNANVSTNNSSKSVPDFLVVTKLDGISVSLIPKSFSRVCDLRVVFRLLQTNMQTT